MFGLVGGIVSPLKEKLLFPNCSSWCNMVTCYNVTVLDEDEVVQHFEKLTTEELMTIIDKSSTHGYTIEVKTIKATLQ